MNRQQRRQAARQRRQRRQGALAPVGLPPLGLPTDMDCDCTPRRLVPMEEARCPACGRTSLVIGPEGAVMHTMAEPGDVTTLHVSCPCGDEEYALLCGVQAL